MPQVLEQSELDQETGAAIILPPNVNGLLRKHSFVTENHGAVTCLGVSCRYFKYTGHLLQR